MLIVELVDRHWLTGQRREMEAPKLRRRGAAVLASSPNPVTLGTGVGGRGGRGGKFDKVSREHLINQKDLFHSMPQHEGVKHQVKQHRASD